MPTLNVPETSVSSCSALICDVKRFAVHDGPGIRTTLFLKGCPLRCLWCHNPESILRKPELGIRFHKCTLCGECAKVCPCHKFENGSHLFDRENCTACGKCVEACLFDASVFYGKPMTPAEAVAVILEDRMFYELSGGGATVSGGEPLLQAGFCAELFALLKWENIHTAVDTCGDLPWSAFETVLPQTDLFLYDFKHPNSEAHRKLTGRGNERIKENLLRLGETGKPIEIRIPLIPSLNTADETLKQSADFLSGVKGITVVRLLAYHALARSKYEAVGHADTMPDAGPPDEKTLQHAAEYLKNVGLCPILPGE